MSLELIAFLLSIALLIMFIIMFVVVIRLWNFQQEILQSGGYPTVSYMRAKQDGRNIANKDGYFSPERREEIIRILSQYPNDPEAVDLVQRLKTQKESVAK